MSLPSIALTHDSSVNYAFQQNAIPVIKELLFQNDGVDRRDLVIRLTTEPAFAEPIDVRLQAIQAGAEFRVGPLDLKLSHDFLAGLNERVSGWLKAEVIEGESPVCSCSQAIALLAHNEWCGLVSLPEILAAFVLPNDPAVMTLLGRASELLADSTGRTALNGYQDRSRKHAWEQVAAIYKAIAERGIRYINPPASFEQTGQKVRFPSDVLSQRFGTCLDLTLLVAACCEQAGLRPLVLMHEGHSYAGCWLEDHSLPEPATDDLQHLRKLATDELITVFETTSLAEASPGVLEHAELLAKPHLRTERPFRLALDIHRARLSRIHPLPIPGQVPGAENPAVDTIVHDRPAEGIGSREFAPTIQPASSAPASPSTRVDQWKSRLLDLSLRNRLINFKETKATVRILSSAPEMVEDELAASRELSLQPRPRMLSEADPRSADTYARQKHSDALGEHLRDELAQLRLHTSLEESENARRLTELYRAARTALDENGTNTLFAAVGILEWKETEHSDRVFRAPLLLVPVELKRKSVLEGFTLRRMDEETRLNVTLMEMLRQNFRKEIPGLDPLPEDDNGVNVARVFQLFRDAVRDLAGWEVKSEIWLGLFSFTKFLLWKDLSDRLDDLTRNRVVRHLVCEAGTPYPNPPDDIRPHELDDRFRPREIFCPRSADSSQLAAVMAAAAGHDFVLEGPPGTGKSQTITNVIAHCLSQGRRVLFVAEKRAALDVVHRRLREDGLDPFCLELHSNKIGKAEVLTQFDRALKFVEEFSPADWERRAADLEGLRSSLNGYVRALHRPTSCGLSAYDCLDHLLPRMADSTVRLDDWPEILDTSAEQLEEARRLSHLLQDRSRPLGPLANHPLADLECENWSPTWAERTLDRIRELHTLTEAAISATRDLTTWLRLPDGPLSRQRLAHLDALAETLLDPRDVGPAFATVPWNQLATDLEEWIALARERGDLRSALGTLHVPDASAPASAQPCETWSDSAADQVFKQGRELRTARESTAEAVRRLHDWLEGADGRSSRAQLAAQAALAESLLAPAPVAEAFVTTRWHEWVRELETWTALVKERVQLRHQLADYDETRLLALDLDTLVRQQLASRSAWAVFRWLRIAGIRRKLRRTRPDNAKPDPATLGDVLKAAHRLRAVNSTLAGALAQAEHLFGPAWERGEPKPETLDYLRTWGATLHERLAACAQGDSAWEQELRGQIGGLFQEGIASFAPGTEVGNRLAQFRDAFATFENRLGTFADDASLARGAFDAADDHLQAVGSVLDAFLPKAQRLRAINVRFAAAIPSGQACLGTLWARGEPDHEALADALDWGARLHRQMLACAGDDLTWLGQLRQLLSGLFGEGPAAYAVGTVIGDRLAGYREALRRFAEGYEAFATDACLRRETFEHAADHLPAVLALTDRLPPAWPGIRDWCSWQKVRHRARSIGLAALVETLEAPEGHQVDVPALFERSFRRALLFASVERESSLREFYGREHAERIEHFREVDEQLAKLARDLIRARLSAGIPRDQVQGDVSKTEIGLLRKEIAKKTRHMPVRQLLSRIPSLLPKLKPCVLMSPLSVAQYLEPSHEGFDVVIFDEASQIPVWDAVGAIARGKQLIVVGDPKQLPPTNFFQNSAEDDEDDRTPEEYQDLESILDELMTHGLRHKRLRWHYRSRHEGLIAFSNRQYYENDLLTFPSPDTVLGGVRFKYLPRARYDKGKSRTNHSEAVALVDELTARLRKTSGPRLSYGVVTFSQVQQKLVEDLLDQKRREYPQIERHFGDAPPVEGEPVFVKNLENVQGDERDVILFSVCYGPDESGKVSMNFGPLNRDGGERRLNVAVTRAKREVVVFSGLRADQIDLTRTRARGVRDLKYFLDYAERGPKALAASNTATGDAEADSEFEHMVAERLRSEGYVVHHQVGCSGYRIDLAVVDPSSQGRYLLGIECDGATYHRAATARDRDKLRQAVLEGLGWKLHRIWSTDWWHNKDREAEKLLTALASLRPTPPADHT